MTIAHGALQAFLAVACGAFGAHALKASLDEYSLGVWQTGVTYHMAHALALVLLGIFEAQRKRREKAAHACFGIGILLFSGSLYALALTGVKALGAVTPLGGLGVLAGWLLFARAGWRSRAA